LLDVSKIESGKLILRPEEFDVKSLLEDTIELISHSNESFVITLHSDLESVMLFGDKYKIEQVIVNLLTNAVRYSNDNKNIEVSLKNDNDNILISVKDYGLVLIPTILKTFFQDFTRFITRAIFPD
jgi:signal transduction histidine kinase